MTDSIDLNADLGEMDDSASIARDRAIMTYISSCNIACGGHAGNEQTMRTMLVAASQANVVAGAHPSYPDRQNFGRISMDISEPDLRQSIIDQILTLAALAKEEGTAIGHVKPHGALYNDAADDPELAALIASAVARIFPGGRLIGLAGSHMETAAKDAGLAFTGEGFADRRYTPLGRLQARGQTGAVIEQQDARVAQALALARGETISDSEGGELKIRCDTICLHSDSDGALKSARKLRRALEDAGLTIAAPA